MRLTVSMLTLLLCGCGDPDNVTPFVTRERQQRLTQDEIIEHFKAGNRRFLAGEEYPRDMRKDQQATAKGQYPLAVVLSCIDSRAPVEHIFDAGIGDLFNVRIAGNFISPSGAGSIEYACKIAGAKVVLVMGHTGCGAIKGACDKVELGNLTGLLANLDPAVNAVDDVLGPRTSKNLAFVNAVAETNVRMTMQRLREISPVIHAMERDGDVRIVGAMYDVSTGAVRFLEP